MVPQDEQSFEYLFTVEQIDLFKTYIRSLPMGSGLDNIDGSPFTIGGFEQCYNALMIMDAAVIKFLSLPRPLRLLFWDPRVNPVLQGGFMVTLQKPGIQVHWPIWQLVPLFRLYRAQCAPGTVAGFPGGSLAVSARKELGDFHNKAEEWLRKQDAQRKSKDPL